MTTRILSGTVRHSDGTAWGHATLRVQKLALGTQPGEVYPMDGFNVTADANGVLPETALAVPETGAWLRRITFPDTTEIDFYLAAGAPISIDEIVALAEEAGSEAGTPQGEMLNGLYTAVSGAADGKMLETLGGDLTLVDAPEGMPEPSSDGLWARFVASAVGSWLQATTVGAALFAAVDAAAGRAALGAAASAGSGTAGELMVSDATGNSVRAGYTASQSASANTVARRTSDGGIAAIGNNAAGVDGRSIHHVGVYGESEATSGSGVSGYSPTTGTGVTGVSASGSGGQSTSMGGTYHHRFGTKSAIDRLSGILKFVDSTAASDRAAQRAELGLGSAALADTDNFDAAGSAAAALAASVSKAGDTMTGALILPGPPVIDLHAATKKYVDDNSGGGYGTNVMIVNGAGGGDYTTLSAALAAITTASASNKFLIVVIGAVAETAAITAKPYVDVVFQSGAVITVTINGIANSFGVSFLGINNCTWSGIGSGPHIIRAGSGTGSQNGLRVQGNDNTLVLHNLVVRNDAIYTTVGAAIYCNSTSAKMIRVTGIGSTAGNDAYGIQLVSASPEMRECVGIGGSNGGSCHGILTGTVSNALMIRCIGYGGNGGISSRGINNAYGSNITMVECIGVGGDYSGGSGLFVNNTTSLRAIRCIGIGGGVLPKNGTATVTASSRQDDSFRAHATLPYRITGLSITVSAAAASGVTLTFRTATAGGGNAITGAVAVDTTGAKYIPVSGNYVISSAAYVYGRLSAVDATLAYTIAYTYELCSNASYGIYHDSDAQVIYEDCTAISNADSEGIYIGGNNGLTKFIGGTARSGRNNGTRRKAMTCLALWNPGQVYDMVLDGGSTNLVAAAGMANGSNVEI